jgi:hypothetical protein
VSKQESALGKKSVLELRDWLKFAALIVGVIVSTIVWFENRFVTEDEMSLLSQRVEVLQEHGNKTEESIKDQLTEIKKDTKDIQALVTQIRIDIAKMAAGEP